MIMTEESFKAKKFLPQNQTVNSNSATPVSTGLAAGAATAWPATSGTLSNPNPAVSSSQLYKKYSSVPDGWSLPPDDENVKIVHDLTTSPHEFFLGGSRAMQKRGANVTITNETDYDFYATDTEEVRGYLLSKKFVLSSSSIKNYLDSEATIIFKKGCIDVVLRNDARFYRTVFESIDVGMYAKHLWKGNPSCDRSKIQPLFNEMFRIARDKEAAAKSDKISDIIKSQIMTEYDNFDESELTSLASAYKTYSHSVVDNRNSIIDIRGAAV